MGNLDEKAELQLKKVESLAEKYYDKYGKYIDLLEHSMLAKVKGKVEPYDAYALGKQLEQWDTYKRICEEQGNVNLLGRIPTIAYDVITAVYGASVIPVIASVQPIEEERGTVYFKQVRSATTKGSQTAGNVVIDPRTGSVVPTGYASNIFSDQVVATTVSGQVAYTFTLPGAPLKRESLSLTLSGTSVQGRDMGNDPQSSNGLIFGIGLSGTVDYMTGVVSITLASDPGDGKDIVATWQQNYELSADLPQVDTFFDSRGVFARVYALKGVIGLLQSFGMSKRFGLVAEDELAKDLVVEINKEIGGDLIRKLKAVALGTTTFSLTPPANVSYFEHKQTYKDQLAVAESVLVDNSGRGSIALLIVGKRHAAVIQTLPGFQRLYDGSTLGTHVFGTLDGVTVVRVVEPNILGTNDGLAVWKGASPFEAAAVYSPFMPLTVTATLPMAPNPLLQMKAAAVWGAVESLVPQFVTNFNIVP